MARDYHVAYENVCEERDEALARERELVDALRNLNAAVSGPVPDSTSLSAATWLNHLQAAAADAQALLAKHTEAKDD